MPPDSAATVGVQLVQFLLAEDGLELQAAVAAEARLHNLLCLLPPARGDDHAKATTVVRILLLGDPAIPAQISDDHRGGRPIGIKRLRDLRRVEHVFARQLLQDMKLFQSQPMGKKLPLQAAAPGQGDNADPGNRQHPAIAS